MRNGMRETVAALGGLRTADKEHEGLKVGLARMLVCRVLLSG